MSCKFSAHFYRQSFANRYKWFKYCEAVFISQHFILEPHISHCHCPCCRWFTWSISQPYQHPINNKLYHIEDNLLNTVVAYLLLRDCDSLTVAPSGFTLFCPMCLFLLVFGSIFVQRPQLERAGKPQVSTEFSWNILHKDWGHTRQAWAGAGDGCLIKERVYILNIHWGWHHVMLLAADTGHAAIHWTH